MARITGLGGIFYKVADPRRRSWYQSNLGIGGEWGAMFRSRRTIRKASRSFRSSRPTPIISARAARSSWSIFRVDDLDGMIADLEGKGIEILGGRMRITAASPGSWTPTG